MMTYDQVIDWLYVQLPMFQSLGAGAYKPGLDTAHTLDDAFGNPHRRFKTIHVAGTNGKGSTSHALASVLQEAGYKVGLYTSPHLVDFRERIRVNGAMMDKASVVDFVERYQAMDLGLQPSFFELTTIMAFDHFAKQSVDYAIIEVGLGGRLDTTNIITPELSIITNISIDHSSLLGDTPAQIAGEKAGIIKSGVPVVVSEAEDEVRTVFQEKADAECAPIVFAEDSPVAVATRDGKYVFSLRPGLAPVAVCDLDGEWQVRNMNGVLHALAVLGIASDDAIMRGLANIQQNTGLQGRWMRIGERPEVVCDTGHNLGAWQYLAPRLQAIADERSVRIVLGFVNDKDVESIFPLLPKNARYYFAAPNVKRARSAESLVELAKRHNLHSTAYGSVREAYDASLQACVPEDFVFVGGSNFVVAEIL